MPRYFHYNSVYRIIHGLLSSVDKQRSIRLFQVSFLGENTSFINCSELPKKNNFSIENNCFDTYEDSSYLADLSFYVEVII